MLPKKRRLERAVVKQVELPGSKTKVIVDQDLTTGDTIVDIGYGKHGWAESEDTVNL